MTLTFPDGFDPRELTDAQIALITRDAWFDRANADLRDAALGADHATLTDADLPDDYWQLPTLEEIDAEATLKLTAAQVAELKEDALRAAHESFEDERNET